MTTKNNEIEKEVEALYQFCKSNKEAVDRLNRIDSLIKECVQSKEKDVLKILDELKTRNINDEGLDVETQDYWINFEELKKRIE